VPCGGALSVLILLELKRPPRYHPSGAGTATLQLQREPFTSFVKGVWECRRLLD